MSSKLREALVKVVYYAQYMAGYMSVHREDKNYGGYIEKINAIRDAALAAPPEPIGNGAKTREALEEIRDATHIWITVGGISARRTIEMVADIAAAALAAPPRNCDLPSVIADPHGAWLKDCDNWDELGAPEKEIYDWLLAEAKGEADGRKK